MCWHIHFKFYIFKWVCTLDIIGQKMNINNEITSIWSTATSRTIALPTIIQYSHSIRIVNIFKTFIFDSFQPVLDAIARWDQSPRSMITLWCFQKAVYIMQWRLFLGGEEEEDRLLKTSIKKRIKVNHSFKNQKIERHRNFNK